MKIKQKIDSIEKQMKLLQENTPDIDMEIASKYFSAIEKYYNLKVKLFLLELFN